VHVKVRRVREVVTEARTLAAYERVMVKRVPNAANHLRPHTFQMPGREAWLVEVSDRWSGIWASYSMSYSP
jgi:hypothetical protein